jgi:hypothetical protein
MDLLFPPFEEYPVVRPESLLLLLLELEKLPDLNMLPVDVLGLVVTELLLVDEELLKPPDLIPEDEDLLDEDFTAACTTYAPLSIPKGLNKSIEGIMVNRNIIVKIIETKNRLFLTLLLPFKLHKTLYVSTTILLYGLYYYFST